MTSPLRDQPWGLQVIENTLKCCAHSRVNRVTWHQGIILALTYLAYTCYHMTRKPMSVVKNVLSFNCSTLPPPPNFLINTSNQDTWCDWAPFGKYNISIISQFKVIQICIIYVSYFKQILQMLQHYWAFWTLHSCLHMQQPCSSGDILK